MEITFVIGELPLVRQALEAFDDLKEIKRFMTEVTASLDRLTTAVRGVQQDAQQKIDALTAALEEERAAYDALVQSEAEEDVEQGAELSSKTQALEDAKAATDAAKDEVVSAVRQIDSLTESLTGGGAAEQPAAEEPVAGAGGDQTAVGGETSEEGTTTA
jgi:chromosome segregation ATPase